MSCGRKQKSLAASPSSRRGPCSFSLAPAEPFAIHTTLWPTVAGDCSRRSTPLHIHIARMQASQPAPFFKKHRALRGTALLRVPLLTTRRFVSAPPVMLRHRGIRIFAYFVECAFQRRAGKVFISTEMKSAHKGSTTGKRREKPRREVPSYERSADILMGLRTALEYPSW